MQAARALGARNGRIIFRHILPNAIAPVIVLRHDRARRFIAAEATLSFLGVGLQPPAISWGITIAAGTGLRPWQAPAPAVFPCAPLIVTVLASSCSATRCATPSTRSCGEVRP